MASSPESFINPQHQAIECPIVSSRHILLMIMQSMDMASHSVRLNTELECKASAYKVKMAAVTLEKRLFCYHEVGVLSQAANT